MTAVVPPPLAHPPWLPQKTSTISQSPIPSFLLSSVFSPLFQPDRTLALTCGAASPDGPLRPRLCLPPLPDSRPLSIIYSFPPAWGVISGSTGRLQSPSPPLASRRRLNSPPTSPEPTAHPEPTTTSPSIASLAALVHVLPLFDVPTSPTLPPSPAAATPPLESPPPPVAPTTESRLPASRARRGIAAVPRKPRVKKPSEEPSTESEEGSDVEGGGEATGVRKRKRRRRASETPRDFAMRKYPCELCGKLFARPSAKKTHLRSHSKEMPYTCPEPTCSQPFAVQSNMRRHCKIWNHCRSAHDAESVEGEPTSPASLGSDEATSEAES